MDRIPIVEDDATFADYLRRGLTYEGYDPQVFTAAKYVNAFWYPQQSLEQAIAFKAAKGLDYNQVDARELTSAKCSSDSGFKAAHQWLANNGLLQQGPGGGNNCGV